ncbi:MAG TPA: HEAT repeat domain-containing protein [Candidatus Binataceae bacterium]|jgi:HEAT repeat protein|nr:HEAT repeat domain-containing protein [Candidatus Binataceae bacterium]
MKVKRQELVEKLSGCVDWGEAQEVLRKAGPDALKGVIAGLDDGDPLIRKWCASFLDHNATSEAIPAMIRALDDKSADVRRHAVHAIGCQPCKLEPLPVDVIAQLIRKATDDPSVRVRRAAVHLLGLQPADPRIISALKGIMRSEGDSKVLSNARFAISEKSNGTKAAKSR